MRNSEFGIRNEGNGENAKRATRNENQCLSTWEPGSLRDEANSELKLVRSAECGMKPTSQQGPLSSEGELPKARETGLGHASRATFPTPLQAQRHSPMANSFCQFRFYFFN